MGFEKYVPANYGFIQETVSKKINVSISIINSIEKKRFKSLLLLFKSQLTKNKI